MRQSLLCVTITRGRFTSLSRGSARTRKSSRTRRQMLRIWWASRRTRWRITQSCYALNADRVSWGLASLRIRWGWIQLFLGMRTITQRSSSASCAQNWRTTLTFWGTRWTKTMCRLDYWRTSWKRIPGFLTTRRSPLKSRLTFSSWNSLRTQRFSQKTSKLRKISSISCVNGLRRTLPFSTMRRTRLIMRLVFSSVSSLRTLRSCSTRSRRWISRILSWRPNWVRIQPCSETRRRRLRSRLSSRKTPWRTTQNSWGERRKKQTKKWQNSSKSLPRWRQKSDWK